MPHLFVLKNSFEHPFLKRECKGKSRSIIIQNYFRKKKIILVPLTIEKELNK